MKFKSVLIFLLVLFQTQIVLANSYPLLLSPYYNNALLPNGSWTYEFNFTTTSSCTGVLFSNTSSVLTNQYGVGFVDLNISTLYQKPGFLCEYANGSLRKTHS